MQGIEHLKEKMLEELAKKAVVELRELEGKDFMVQYINLLKYFLPAYQGRAWTGIDEDMKLEIEIHDRREDEESKDD